MSRVIMPKNSRPNTLYKKVGNLIEGNINSGGKNPIKLKPTENKTTVRIIKPRCHKPPVKEGYLKLGTTAHT
jgi:hypothetical protein